jgi:hypothetical protein
VPPKRPAPAARLTDYQRETLIRTTEFWGDEMVRCHQDAQANAAEHGLPGPERIAWLADQASGWYEIARLLRTKQAVK